MPTNTEKLNQHYNYLIKINELYTNGKDSYDLESALHYFNSFDNESKDQIIYEYFKNFDSRYEKPNQHFIPSLFKLFSMYENFNKVANYYISDPNCSTFIFNSSTYNAIFDYIIIEDKDVFLKFIFGKHFSTNLFLNCANFDFTQSEKERLVTLLNSKKIQNYNLYQQKAIFQKIGYFYTFLNFNFNDNNFEEFLFFNQNINVLDTNTEQEFYGRNTDFSKLPENNINVKIINNFFNNFKDKFNYNFFFIFAKENNNLYPEIKNFVISRNKLTKYIFDNIDCMLTLEDF